MAVATVITLLGTLTAAGLEMYGMSKQEDENEKARAANKARYREGVAISDRDYGLSVQKMRENTRERKKQWKWMEEERNYDRTMRAVDRLVSMSDRRTRNENDLLRIWPRSA